MRNCAPVSKNGKLVSSVSQEEKEDAKAGQKPRHHKMTKLDIPELDIHQQFEDNGEEEEGEAPEVSNRVHFVKRNVSVMITVLSALTNLISQAGLEMPTAEDMAEYILSTGDQQTVAQLIEAMVEGGEVSS